MAYDPVLNQFNMPAHLGRLLIPNFMKKHVQYTFQAPDDIFSILPKLTAEFPCLASVELGLSELMLNAVEHGNLGITYEEKTALLSGEDGTFNEIERRLAMPEYKEREAYIEAWAEFDETIVMVVDQGAGFDWKVYLNKSLAEVAGLHGRGILLSESMFKTLTYIGKGNKVIAVMDS